jgi:ABC-type spermidine/putrescine transport system permease subunit I
MDTVKRYWWLIGLFIALALALLSPLASPYLDGLERVAEDQGFLDRAEDAAYEVLPDYQFPGIQSEALSTIVAGLVGTLVVFGIAYGLAWVVRRLRAGKSAT